MEKYLRYNKPANVFEEALPIGNGTLGAMVYGHCDKERISLNHDTLWSGTPGQVMVPGAYEAFQKAQALVVEGNNYEAQLEMEQNFTGRNLNSYLFLGSMYIESFCEGETSDYIRILDMETSTVTVNYTKGGIKYNREYFISYPDDCLMVSLTSDKPASYFVSGETIGNHPITARSGVLYFEGECPSQIARLNNKDSMSVVFDGNGIKFTAMAGTQTDGKVISVEGGIKIDDATCVVLMLCVQTSFVSFDKAPDKATYESCANKLLVLLEKNYDKIKNAHISDVRELYGRVEVDFGGENTDKPTDERLVDRDDEVALCELLYNFGRYLMIASSRKGSRATNLQGIWNESLYPAWSSNYTVNINTQMNYWPVFMCNLAECSHPLIELIKNISENGRETAKHFYHADGFVCHHNCDIWANTTPVGNRKVGCSSYALWNMSSGWLCRHLYEYFEYTCDKDFLCDVAYPIMKESAQFYLSVMIKHDGKWFISPSTSPENSFYKDGRRIHVALYATMTQSIVYDLFANTLKCAQILGIDDEFTALLNERIDDIAIYKLGSDGQLLEYDDDYEEGDLHHRHVSHLYAFYPADTVTTENNPEIAESIRKTLERRGDESTGWSMGWKASLWAKLKDGERTMKIIKAQLTPVIPSSEKSHSYGGTYPNMFDAHPPFQIDGNFGVIAGITQMFLQCEDGKIKILPALPSNIKSGKIKGIMAKGNIKVDIEWKDSKISSLGLTSPFEQDAIVVASGKESTVHLNPNETYNVISLQATAQKV